MSWLPLALGVVLVTLFGSLALLGRLDMRALVPLGALRRQSGVTGELARATRYYEQGRTAEALDAVRRVLDALSLASCPWPTLNVLVCIMIAAGRYREALGARRRWPRAVRERAEPAGQHARALTHLNLVEALYNAGKLRAAERLLSRIEAACAASPLALSGHRLQQAWLFTLQGRADQALAQLDRLDALALGDEYRSEIHLTRAAALRDLGALDAAEAEARLGLVSARRASSERNAIFLLGSIAHARGDLALAVRELERGASHHYRGQGGDALLLLAACYEQLGQLDRAGQSRALVLRRDPQSGAAQRVRARLARRAQRTPCLA